MKRVAALATGILGFALACSALAQIYRWTDEDGKVHFSDKPPRDREAEDISDKARSVNIDSSGEERDKLNRLFAPEAPEEKQARREREAQQKAEQQEHQARCQNARQELRFFEEERFYWVDDEGNSENASEAERQEVVAHIREAIQRHCQ